MKKLALLLAMGCFSTMAWGQAGEFWFNYGESLISTNIGSVSPFDNSQQVSLTNGYRFSFRFDFNVGDHYGAEVGYAFNHSNLNFGGGEQEGMHMHQGTFNAMYYPFTGTDAKIRPFATAGIQFDNFVPPGGQSFYGSTKFGANFGAGVKIHVKGIWGVRFDAREYVTPKPSFGLFNNSGALWQTELSAGVGVGF